MDESGDIEKTGPFAKENSSADNSATFSMSATNNNTTTTNDSPMNKLESDVVAELSVIV